MNSLLLLYVTLFWCCNVGRESIEDFNDEDCNFVECKDGEYELYLLCLGLQYGLCDEGSEYELMVEECVFVEEIEECECEDIGGDWYEKHECWLVDECEIEDDGDEEC